MAFVLTTRTEIAAIVERVAPYDDLEAAHKRDVLDWIVSGAELFRRAKPDIPPKHLVSYVVPVDRDRGRVLLVDHRLAGLWLPPGGHVEPDEHPAVAAARELRGELGATAVPADGDLVASFVTVTPTRGGVPHTDVSLWHEVGLDGASDLDWDRGEFAGVRWFDVDELMAVDPATLDPHLYRFTRKRLAQDGAVTPACTMSSDGPQL